MNLMPHNLTEENYFLDKTYLNCSTLKTYRECSSKALSISKGEYTQDFSDNDAILVGKYVDAAVEGTLEEFLENNPKVYSYGKKEKGLRKPFEDANIMIEKLKNDKYANILLEGDKQTIYVGEIAGIKVKCKIDNISHEKAVALKSLPVVKTISETLDKMSLLDKSSKAYNSYCKLLNNLEDAYQDIYAE